MTQTDPSTTGVSDRDGANLRLLWPQWQGAGTPLVEEAASEFPFDVARRGYTVGTEVIGRHDPARIVTIGGDCAVSVAPFSELARRYGDDLAVVWIDSHPDVSTPGREYLGYHAMAVTALTGHGDPDVQELLPANVSPDRVALVGLHSWADDDFPDFPNIAEWGIRSFGPDELRESAQPLLDWLAATGCSRVALHFDVDAVDSNEVVFGLAKEPDGLTGAEVRRIVTGVGGAADVVGFTVAEFIPRQVMHLRQILDGFPLISKTAAG